MGGRDVVDEEDRIERKRTRYVLREVRAEAAACAARACCSHRPLSLDPGAGFGVANGPPRGSSAARAPGLFS